MVARITTRQVNSFDGVTAALMEAERVLSNQILAAETATTLRIRALSELDIYAKDLKQIADLKAANALIGARLAAVEKAGGTIGNCRTQAKTIADAADKVRSDIVKAVFNSLFRLLNCRQALAAKSRPFSRPYIVPEKHPAHRVRC